MSSSRDELERLARLRALFLDVERGDAALPGYWRDAGDLAAYDAVLAERIGWKWDAALAECAERGWPRDDAALVLDWGCGSGVAARRFATRFGASEIVCHDRSPQAMDFATRRLAECCPAIPVRSERRVDGLNPDVLLLSHVLGELDARGELELREIVARSRAVLIVEPGTREVARRLSALRDQLAERFRVLAPCTHEAACPALATPHDWCHFFAPPPPEVFTDGDWVRTARDLGIDLRALPYAFLALRDRSRQMPPPPAQGGSARVLGRPSVGRRSVRLHVCDADGLRTVEVEKRESPALFRTLDKKPHQVRLLPHEATRDEL